MFLLDPSLWQHLRMWICFFMLLGSDSLLGFFPFVIACLCPRPLLTPLCLCLQDFARDDEGGSAVFLEVFSLWCFCGGFLDCGVDGVLVVVLTKALFTKPVEESLQ